MRILTVIFCIYFLCACSEKEHSVSGSKQAGMSEAKISANVASPANQASQTGICNVTQATPKECHIGVSLLGMSFNDFLSRFNYDHTEVFEGQLFAYKNGKPIFGLSDKKGLQDKIVWDIEILSPNINSDKGIHVGMSIQELLRVFPGLELQMSHEDGGEFFELQEIHKGTQKMSDVAILINVRSKNGTPLGSGNLWEYPTKQYKTDGVIDSIDVYKTGNT